MHQRFTAAPTIDGFEVIDEDGRPVTEARPTRAQANGAAQHLNQAALGGPKALARALRAA